MCASIHIWLPADLILCLALKRTRRWSLELFLVKSGLFTAFQPVQKLECKEVCTQSEKSGIISTTINTTMSIIFQLLREVEKIVGLWSRNSDGAATAASSLLGTIQTSIIIIRLACHRWLRHHRACIALLFYYVPSCSKINFVNWLE